MTSALDGVDWSALRPSRFTPKEIIPGTNWVGGWEGSQVGLNVMVEEKILPLPGFEPRPSSPQPVSIPTELSRLLLIINTKLQRMQREADMVYFEVLSWHLPWAEEYRSNFSINDQCQGWENRTCYLPNTSQKRYLVRKVSHCHIQESLGIRLVYNRDTSL
jgi:hypothetical protein